MNVESEDKSLPLKLHLTMNNITDKSLLNNRGFIFIKLGEGFPEVRIPIFVLSTMASQS